MSVRDLPDYPPKDEVTETSNPSRVTLNSTSAPREQRLSLIAGEGAFVPFGYGRDTVGAVVPKVTVYNGSLVLLLVWCLGEIEAVEDVLLSDGSALPGGITLTDYTGTTTQGVDATLAAAFPGWANNLVATVEGQSVGLAYTVASIPAGVTTGVPELVAKLRLRKVYDPREAGHLEHDPATWEWSENPALAKGDFERSALYGRGRAVDWASVEAAADACDELVGDEKRRLIGLMLDQQATVDAWSATLNGYAKCFTIDNGDRIKLLADRPRAATRSITDADILHDRSGAPQLEMSLRGLEDAPTVVKVVYTNTTGDQWRDAYAYAMAPGVDAGTVEWRESVVRLPGIQRYSQARREGIERYNQLNLADLDLEEVIVVDTGLQDQAGDVVAITSAVGLAAKEFALLSVEPVEPGRWRLSGLEYQSNVYSDVVESDPVVGDTSLPNPSKPPAVTGLALAEEVYQRKDGTYSSRIRATWDDPGFVFTARYLVKTYDGPSLVFSGDSGTSEEYVTPAIQESVTYTLEVCIVSTTGAVGTADIEQITAQGKQLVPGDVPSMTGFEVGGEVRLSWEPAVDIDIWRYEVRYGAVAVAWADATLIDRVDALRLVSKEIPVGTWEFLVKALDSVGQYSNAEARRTITVTLDAAAFLVDTHAIVNPTLTNAKAFRLGRTDALQRWVTNPGDIVDNLLTVSGDALDKYTNTLDTYHSSTSSEWLSETWDIGSQITGNWVAEVDATALSGSYTAYLELSEDNTNWDQYSALTAKRSARYARVRLATATTGTLLVTAPTAMIHVDAVPREENGYETSSASGPVTVQMQGTYTAAKRMVVTPEGSTARSGTYDRLIVAPESGLVYQNECTAAPPSNSYQYWEISTAARVIASGDYLEFDFFMADAPPGQTYGIGGFNVNTTSGWLSAIAPTCVLGSGHIVNPLSGSAQRGIWVSRKFDLTLLVGATTSTFQLVRWYCSNTGFCKCLYRNIRISDGAGTSRLQIYSSGEPSVNRLGAFNLNSINGQAGPANAFHTYVFDASGNKIASPFRWDFQGV